MPFTEVAAERMQRLASTRSPYRGRRANPSLADLGLDESVERRRFEAYCSRFNIRSFSLNLRRPEAIETP
jgi:hypothetical protein